MRGVIAKKGNIPVGYYKDEKKTAETFQMINGVRYAIRGLRPSRGGRHGHHAGSWLGVDQQRSGRIASNFEEVEAALRGIPT